MRQASEKQKGKNWFVELLIFFLVFLIASILSGFLMIPGYVIAVISDSSIMELFLSGASSVEEYSRIAALIESSLPVTLSMLFANAGLILIAILFCVIFQKRKVSSMGFIKEKAGTQYLIGMGIGFLLFGAVTLINIMTGAMTIEGISKNFSFGVFLLFALGFAIQGMAEEVLCRGYFMVSVSRRYSVITAANPGVSVAAIVNISCLASSCPYIFCGQAISGESAPFIRSGTLSREMCSAWKSAALTCHAPYFSPRPLLIKYSGTAAFSEPKAGFPPQSYLWPQF